MNTRRKILVVEDNIVNSLMLRNILSQNYETLEANDGQEALKILNHAGQDISLIFLDIQIARMEGNRFLDQLQADKIYNSIPIILVTQYDDEEEEVYTLTHGVSDFITKPYKPLVILRRTALAISEREMKSFINTLEYDQLTGLYSQAFFCEHMRQMLRQNPEKQYDLICSNVQDFKFINKVFGVAIGDEILRLTARELQRSLPNNSICGRLRSDILICMTERGSYHPENLLYDSISKIRAESGVDDLFIKWGLYEITDPSIPVERMCDWALVACNSIKGRYGQTVAYYDDALCLVQLQELILTGSMETALQEGQFQIYYQPKFNLRSMRICGAEALVQWNHPTLGVLFPDKFMPILERNGVVPQLDAYVWNEVAAALHSWEIRNLGMIPISVSISPADLYQADLESTLNRIQETHHINPRQMHLAISEISYTQNHQQFSDVIAALRDSGFIIEIDNFGSGYTSLNLLNELSIDALKLDLRYLSEDQGSGNQFSILGFVVRLAQWLNLQVIAKGVETQEQMENLRSIGCNYAQGCYFSPPLSLHEFEQFLEDAEDYEEETERTYEDILERTRLLEAAAFEDYLTGLLNRRGLNNALEQATLPLGNTAIFIFDMDDLKRCNDSQGHSGGDEMLRRFSKVLRSHTRRSDILSRIGGDEFLAVIPGISTVEAAQKKGQDICTAFQNSDLTGSGTYASCSAGLAILQCGELFEDAFARADQALYRAKGQHKGACFI